MEKKRNLEKKELEKLFASIHVRAKERNTMYKREDSDDLRSVLAMIPPYANNTPLKRIPHRIANQILQQLDTQTALICRLVCKRWEGLISLAHAELTLPEKCDEHTLRMLITLFPKVRHIILPSDFTLHKFEWETLFPINSRTTTKRHKPTIDISKISTVERCFKLSRTLRKKSHEHDLIISILTRALALVQTSPKPTTDQDMDIGEAEIYFLRAVSLLEGHRFEECLKDCNTALGLIPENGGNLEIISLRGKVLVELDRFEEALKDLELAIVIENTFLGIQEQTGDALDGFSRDWSLLDYRGEAMRQLGRFDDALASFDKVIESNPNACSYHSRGLVQAELFRYHEAIDDFTEAINLEPHETSYCERSWACYRVDLYERTIEDCIAVQKLCIGKAPDNFYLPWTFALFELRRIEEAYEMSLLALEYDSQDSLPLVAHAVALQGLKRYRESLHYFDKALELRSDDDWALVRRAKTYCHFQKHDEALEGLGRSLKRFPNNRSTLFHRSYVLKKLGRYEEALEDLNNLAIEEEKLRISESSLRRQRGVRRREKILRLLGRS
eukprot:TRINITY_DN12544_c0_g1_i2.p1 TRINITY_DN12544_c0_g1~~TRINITY_DN12544_c0_g1_i2.p1  ORF type:complete len:559 (-),score=85.29 TRINITY_DN12544_c0_g1_i2:10-1686(-)